MVKHFNEQLRRQELIQNDKLIAKSELLRKLRRQDLVKDTKRNCLKRGLTYTPPKLNIQEYLLAISEDRLPANYDETAKEVHSYKVALTNTQNVLKQLETMGVKNDRPADYLVEMFKSDKQMFKVRRHLTEKEEKIKEKMQGKDWQSKTQRREKAKRKAEAKRGKKKEKTAAKRNEANKLIMTKVNGKKKVKK